MIIAGDYKLVTSQLSAVKSHLCRIRGKAVIDIKFQRIIGKRKDITSQRSNCSFPIGDNGSKDLSSFNNALPIGVLLQERPFLIRHLQFAIAITGGKITGSASHIQACYQIGISSPSPVEF